MDIHEPYSPVKPPLSPLRRHQLLKLNVKAESNKYGVSESKTLSEKDIEELIDLYDDKISYVDESIGSLLNHLRSSNVLGNTVVVVTSDHGQQFMEHGHFGHRFSLYEESIRVPLIITGPTVDRSVIDKQVSLLDLAPTILDILGIEKPCTFLGTSLLPLTGKSAVKDTDIEIFSETNQLNKAIHGRRMNPKTGADDRKVSLRTETWKYIHTEDGQDELYSLKDDPGERKNLLNNEPEVAYKLKTRITEHMSFENKTAPTEEEIITARIKQLKERGKI